MAKNSLYPYSLIYREFVKTSNPHQSRFIKQYNGENTMFSFSLTEEINTHKELPLFRTNIFISDLTGEPLSNFQERDPNLLSFVKIEALEMLSEFLQRSEHNFNQIHSDCYYLQIFMHSGNSSESSLSCTYTYYKRRWTPLFVQI